MERAQTKRISELEHRLRDMNMEMDKKEKKLKDFATASLVKKENSKKEKNNGILYSPALLSEEFVFKNLTEEIEEFYNSIRNESMKIEETRKLLIKELKDIVSKEFNDFEVFLKKYFIKKVINVWFVCCGFSIAYIRYRFSNDK